MRYEEIVDRDPFIGFEELEILNRAIIFIWKEKP